MRTTWGLARSHVLQAPEYTRVSSLERSVSWAERALGASGVWRASWGSISSGSPIQAFRSYYYFVVRRGTDANELAADLYIFHMMLLAAMQV